MADEFAVGQKIEHNLMPGFVMTIQAVEPCEGGDHAQYQITDPEGQTDWLCARDVRLVSS